MQSQLIRTIASPRPSLICQLYILTVALLSGSALVSGRTAGPVQSSVELREAFKDAAVNVVTVGVDLVFDEQTWNQHIVYIDRNVTVRSDQVDRLHWRVLDLQHLSCKIKLAPGVTLTLQHLYLFQFAYTGNTQQNVAGELIVLSIMCSIMPASGIPCRCVGYTGGSCEEGPLRSCGSQSSAQRLVAYEKSTA